MNTIPTVMEDYFQPGFKTKPLLHIGSQTLKFWKDIAEEQAVEGFHMVASVAGDTAVVRDMDPEYLSYWHALVKDSTVINLQGLNPQMYLSQAIMQDTEALNTIKNRITADHNLLVFTNTELEEKLAQQLGVKLYGSRHISDTFGTKSGIRALAEEANIPMPKGYICTTKKQALEALLILKETFETVVLKHDSSANGYGSKRIAADPALLEGALNEVSGGVFQEYVDTIVIEGWLKGKVSLCAHIEILPNHTPVVCSAWQQILDTDGLTYIGGGPLMLSEQALQKFIAIVQSLATCLAEKGAVGSFGPDVLVIDEGETNEVPDSCVLLELNARVPFTALPLELVKYLRGSIGSGFCTSHIQLAKDATFKDIEYTLEKENLLITHADPHATGVVPFNVGVLPWRKFDIVAMADTWEETSYIVGKVKKIFE